MAKRSHRIFPAVFHGDLAKVRQVVKAEPESVAVCNAKDLTPLHVAASRGQDKVIKFLLGKGADVTGPTARDEWTPLVFASYRGHVDAVKVLLEAGADPTSQGGNPIHYAGQRGHKEICRLLVEHGAIDKLIRSKDPDVLRLFRTTYSYDAELVEQILAERPQLVNRKDKNGRTPLHEACTSGDRHTVKVLLQHGADPHVVDKQGQTPLDRARAHRQRTVIKLLEQHI